MKVEYNLNINDYTKARFEQLKMRYIFAILLYVPFSLLISFIIFKDKLKFNEFVMTFFIVFLLFIVIPDFLKHRRISKAINSNPNLFDKKILELNEFGIKQFSENNKEIGFLWQEIKKITQTKNYVSILLKNKTSIILPNNNAEFIYKLKESHKKYGT